MELLKQAKHSLVVLDDLMYCSWEFLAKIFTIYSHYFKFLIFKVQNFFYKVLRKITLNAQIVTLFKNYRDVNQNASFLCEVFSENYKNALTAYKDATCQQRRYLLINFLHLFCEPNS